MSVRKKKAVKKESPPGKLMKVRKGDISIFTIPNLLSVSRIIFALCIGGIYTNSNNNELVLVLFVCAGATDVLDGWIARRLDKVSLLGEALDRIGDLILYSIVIFCAMTSSISLGYFAEPSFLCYAILLAHIILNPIIYPIGCEYQKNLRKFCSFLIFLLCAGLLSGVPVFLYPRVSECILLLLLFAKLIGATKNYSWPTFKLSKRR